MSKRSAKEFIEGSDEFSIKKFVSEYANSDDSVTIDSLSEKYQISGIDKIFEYAIVNCIVSFKTAQKMKFKAHRNQARHCKKEVLHTASDRYYSNLFKKRFEYVTSQISDDKIREMVDAYIASPDLSAEILADMFLGLSKRELNALLEKAIVFNLIDDEKCNTLKAVAFDKVPEVRQKVVISELFNRYERFRSYYKDLSSRIVQLHFQLETYDDFIFSDEDEDEHDKANKEKELRKLQKEFEVFRKNYYF